MHLTAQQVDTGEWEQCAISLIFMVTSEALMFPRLRRQVGPGAVLAIAGMLWLLGAGNDRHVGGRGIARTQNCDLAIGAKYVRNFRLERLVAPLLCNNSPCVV